MPALPTPVTAEAGREDDERERQQYGNRRMRRAEPAGQEQLTNVPDLSSGVDAGGETFTQQSGRPNPAYGQPASDPTGYGGGSGMQDLRDRAEGDQQYENLLTVVSALGAAGSALAGGGGNAGAIGSGIVEGATGLAQNYNQEQQAARQALDKWRRQKQQNRFKRRQRQNQRRYEQAQYQYRQDQKQEAARDQITYENQLEQEAQRQRANLRRGTMELEEKLNEDNERTARMRARAALNRSKGRDDRGGRPDDFQLQTPQAIDQRIQEYDAAIQQLQAQEKQYTSVPDEQGPDGTIYTRTTDRAGRRQLLGEINELRKRKAFLQQRKERLQQRGGQAQQPTPTDPRGQGQRPTGDRGRTQRGGQAPQQGRGQGQPQRQPQGQAPRGGPQAFNPNDSAQIEAGRKLVQRGELSPEQFEAMFGQPYE